jgi:hypothetical protein
MLKRAIVNEKLREMNKVKPESNSANLKMECLSRISFYDIIPTKQIESYVMKDKRLA